MVGQFTKGLAGMAKQRKVRAVTGTGKFVSANELEIAVDGGKPQLLRFEYCIIAAGSQAVKLPAFPWDDPRMMDSTDALELAEIPKKLLVVGGGIIGLEMATVFHALGSEVTVVEFMDQLMPGADLDLVKPLADRLKKQGVAVHLKTKVVEAKAQKAGIDCTFEGASIPETTRYDRVLVAVGRAPNGGKLDADKAGIRVTERGFIDVDRQMRTNVPHIFAIGDLIGQPMLAHKATHEGKLAAEVAAGEKSEWVARVIPSVAYTDPEIAWVGVTENEAKAKGLKVGVGKFPWAASARAVGTRPQRRLHQADLRRGHAPHRRRRHRRRARRRPDHRTHARDRDGLRGRRHRPYHPSASDAERIGRHGRRGVRRHDHGSLHPEEEIIALHAFASRRQEPRMPKLYDLSNDQLLGTISQADLDLLIAQLEETSSKDRDYYVNNDTFLMLVDAGASSTLLDAVKAALALSAEADIRWEAD